MAKAKSYNGMKIGDIITTYHKGYWRLIGIQRRFLTKDDLKYHVYHNKNVGDEYSPIFEYEQVFTSNFQGLSRQIVKQCDASYCKKITKESVEEMKQEAIEGFDRLLAVLV